MKRIIKLIVACLALSGILAINVYSADIGVVFMHGKSGSPNIPAIRSIIEAMKSAGMEVRVPDMPWSRSRGYNASYEDAMREIHKNVEEMMANGVKAVFVAGHSLGANSAIGYGAIFGRRGWNCGDCSRSCPGNAELSGNCRGQCEKS